MQKKLDKLATTTSDPSWSIRLDNLRRKSLYPFKESTIVKIKELCNDCSDRLQLAIEVLHIDVSLLALGRLDDLKLQVADVTSGVRDIKGEIMETKDGISTLILNHTDETLARAIDWLSPLQGVFECRQQDHYNLKGRQDRGGQNLLQNPVFEEWLTQPRKFSGVSVGRHWQDGHRFICNKSSSAYHRPKGYRDSLHLLQLQGDRKREREKPDLQHSSATIVTELHGCIEVLDMHQKHSKSKMCPLWAVLGCAPNCNPSFLPNLRCRRCFGRM
jgi:hypothetical protein